MHSSKLADEMEAVWIRGIGDRWKQILGYYFVAGSVGKDRFKHILLQSVAACCSVGLDPVAVTFDQESTQWMFVKECSVTAEHPTFMLQLPNGVEKQLHVVIDVPHCLKNMRNALRGHDIEFGKENDRKTARWDDIVAAFNADSSKMKQMRLLPKVTDAHINLTLAKKMSVRLAANVLSRSMAQAVRTYSKYGHITSPTAEDTACFCEDVDYIFELSNNSNFLNGIAVENLEDKVAQLQWCILWLKGLKLFKRKINSPDCSETPSSRHRFMKAWQISLGSFVSLSYKLVRDNGVKRLLTRWLTQDHVENGFSCIRRRGGLNDRPMYHEARSALASLAVNSLLSCQPLGKNCEEEYDSSLFQPDSQFSVTETCDTTTAVAKLDNVCDLALDDDVRPVFNFDNTATVETEKQAYVGGYVLRKIFKSVCQCDICQQALQRSKDDNSDGVSFIQLKQSVEALEFGGRLIVPAPCVVRLIGQLESVFYKNIDRLFTGDHLCATLKRIMFHEVDVEHLLNVHDSELEMGRAETWEGIN